MFERVFERRENTTNEGSTIIDWTSFISERSGITTDEAYSQCLKLLGDTIGKIKVEISKRTDKGNEKMKDHYLYELLRLRPNSSMSSFDTFSTFMRILKHYGQAGLYIQREIYSGKVKALYPVKINGYTIDNAGLIKSDKDNKIVVDFSIMNEIGSCFEKDIIILRDNTLNGINGKSVKRSLKNTIKSNIKAQEYQKDLFSNGLTNKAVVQLTSDVKEEKDLGKIQAKFNRIYSNNGRIFTVPAGYNITPLNLNLADSQFAELKVLGKKSVSGAMGVPFSFIDDLKSISDEDIASFISLAIYPVIEALEQEMDWKLLSKEDRANELKIRFNINGLLRTTPETQQKIICEYVKQGVYSLNYAKEILDVPLLKEDVTVFPSGQVTLEQLIAGNVSYVEEQEGDE